MELVLTNVSQARTTTTRERRTRRDRIAQARERWKRAAFPAERSRLQELETFGARSEGERTKPSRFSPVVNRERTRARRPEIALEHRRGAPRPRCREATVQRCTHCPQSLGAARERGLPTSTLPKGRRRTLRNNPASVQTAPNETAWQ